VGVEDSCSDASCMLPPPQSEPSGLERRIVQGWVVRIKEVGAFGGEGQGFDLVVAEGGQEGERVGRKGEAGSRWGRPSQSLVTVTVAAVAAPGAPPAALTAAAAAAAAAAATASAAGRRLCHRGRPWRRSGASRHSPRIPTLPDLTETGTKSAPAHPWAPACAPGPCNRQTLCPGYQHPAR